MVEREAERADVGIYRNDGNCVTWEQDTPSLLSWTESARLLNTDIGMDILLDKGPIFSIL